jgi:hypothetical protein
MSPPQTTRADENPFAAPPLSSGAPRPADDAEIGALAGARTTLAKTRPWVLGVAIVGFILSAAILISTVSNLAFLRGQAGLFQLLIFTAMPLIIGGLGFALSLLLAAYAARIKRFRDAPTPDTLTRALEAQTAFWRLAGIALLVTVALYVALIIALTADLATYRWGTGSPGVSDVEIEAL